MSHPRGGAPNPRSRFGDGPESGQMPDDLKKKIMHIALPVGNGNMLMATDMVEGFGPSYKPGNNFNVSVQPDSISSHMPMVALADLIVVAQHTNIIMNEGQSVFECMRRPRQWAWQLPNYQLGECSFTDQIVLAQQQFGFHVGEYTNSHWCCQQHQQAANERNDVMGHA